MVSAAPVERDVGAQAAGRRRQVWFQALCSRFALPFVADEFNGVPLLTFPTVVLASRRLGRDAGLVGNVSKQKGSAEWTRELNGQRSQHWVY